MSATEQEWRGVVRVTVDVPVTVYTEEDEGRDEAFDYALEQGAENIGYGLNIVDTVRADLESVGLTDEVDVARLIAAWDILHSAGASAPSEQKPNGKPKDEAATEAQWTLVKRLCGDQGQPVPGGPLTKAQVSEVIDTLKAGTYDAAKWSIPF